MWKAPQSAGDKLGPNFWVKSTQYRGPNPERVPLAFLFSCGFYLPSVERNAVSIGAQKFAEWMNSYFYRGSGQRMQMWVRSGNFV